MTPYRLLGLAGLLVATSATVGSPAMAQVCTHNGPDVTCDDGRHGMLSGDAILWPDGYPVEPCAAPQRHHRQQIVGGGRTGRVRRPGQGCRAARQSQFAVQGAVRGARRRLVLQLRHRD